MTSVAVIDIEPIEGFNEMIVKRRQQSRSSPSCAAKERVRCIVNRVRDQGDKGVTELTRWIDRIELEPEQLLIPSEVISAAYAKVSKEQIQALEDIASRIRFVSEQTLNRMTFTMDVEGTKVTSTYRPLAEVGCYVPGGEAAYPSSLLMCAVPAMVAGVKRIVVCTPPKADGVHPLTLVAADMCGIKEIYQVGGAQAIAALAYGTDMIRPVQKIVGPGNSYVALAKSEVSKHVLIDMPAGPSELLVLADETASPRAIALDMISQAEHSTDAVSVLISTSKRVCEDVSRAMSEILPDCPRKEIVDESLKQFGGIYYNASLAECIRLANEFGAEHLQIMTVDACEVANQITSAGLILLGNYTPVAASDYGLGVNHVLPTQGYSAIYSGLSVFDFVRIIRIAESSESALRTASDSMCTIAESEGLRNHARAIRGRFEK